MAAGSTGQAVRAVMARGDGVSGAPIMSGNFKRASSDDDLIKLLRNGIPNTTMQAQRDLSETQARHCLSSIDGLVLEFRWSTCCLRLPLLR